MRAEEFISAQLAELCWREAGRHGGIDNLLAVACVVRNRVQAGWRGGDWLELICQHGEYGARAERGNCGAAELMAADDCISEIVQLRVETDAGEIARFDLPCRLAEVVEFAAPPPVTPDLHAATMRLLLAQIDDVGNGQLEDRWTQGALFYAELDQPRRAWFQQNVLERAAEHPRAAQVGPVTFFK